MSYTIMIDFTLFVIDCFIAAYRYNSQCNLSSKSKFIFCQLDALIDVDEVFSLDDTVSASEIGSVNSNTYEINYFKCMALDLGWYSQVDKFSCKPEVICLYDISDEVAYERDKNGNNHQVQGAQRLLRVL